MLSYLEWTNTPVLGEGRVRDGSRRTIKADEALTERLSNDLSTQVPVPRVNMERNDERDRALD